ncbi:hypothetical protein VP01_2508g3 [Puccinia sorghi]|uniref:Uncharacterized protein n=1 Tax=Puccinia sorghi TaxID=27349 RepID=A0A0L6V7F8_9BASI|nr:hypothetical protein VP01_2508g3 [Puccinia sorghi]
MAARKGKAPNMPRPPPTPVPLLSPQIWMAEDFDPEAVSIPRMRAILDYTQVTDSYYRKFQQTALFVNKVLPRVKALVAKHGGDISTIDDSVLLKEILMIPKVDSRKRRASSVSSGQPATDDHPQPPPLLPLNQLPGPKKSNKKFKPS